MWNGRNSDAHGQRPPQELEVEMTSSFQSTFAQENPLRALAAPTTAAHKKAEAETTGHVSVDLDLGDHIDVEVTQIGPYSIEHT
jgi:hypothetical protein